MRAEQQTPNDRFSLERRDARHRGSRRDDDPAAARPAALEPVALAGGHRARHHLDSRRFRGHDRRRNRQHADRPGRARSHDPAIGLGGHLLPRRGDHGRALLRPSHRPLRAQAAVHGHARGLPRLHRGLRARWNYWSFVGLPLPRRRRHRRRVRRDQLGDRRADPGACPRSRRACDQRQLVGRDRGGGLLLLRAAPAPGRVDRLAARLLHRRHARARDHPHPALHPREPALAAHARTRGGGERVVADIEEAVRKQHPVLPEPQGAPIVFEQRERSASRRSPGT